jgi:predicted ArsR family transcriptional regulator
MTNTKRKKITAKKSTTKSEAILMLLRRKNGASIEELANATGWQPHSVRGFLSGTIKKKLGLYLAVEKRDGAASRYALRNAP